MILRMNKELRRRANRETTIYQVLEGDTKWGTTTRHVGMRRRQKRYISTQPWETVNKTKEIYTPREQVLLAEFYVLTNT